MKVFLCIMVRYRGLGLDERRNNYISRFVELESTYKGTTLGLIAAARNWLGLSHERSN